LTGRPPQIIVHGRYGYALELARLTDGMRVVDWGCADGSFARLICGRFPASGVLACDIPYPGGRPRFASQRVDYHVLDEARPALPIDGASVDRVFALDVLEHMGRSSLPVALAEMRRILRPDGLLIVTVPHKGVLSWTDVENARFRFPRLHRFVFERVRGRSLYRERYGDDPLANFSSDALEHHHYTETELLGLLSSAGFEPRDQRFFGIAHVLPWSLTMLIELLRRHADGDLARLERLATASYRFAVDAQPPRTWAESMAVAASPLAVK
jgi:SAM-dependent methyltransferase